MKTILVLGNTWHGNWSTTLYRELEKQGYTCVHRNVRPTTISSIHLINTIWKKFFAILVEIRLYILCASTRVETCIVITPYTVSPRVWRYLRSKNIRLVGWWGDDPAKKKITGETIELFDVVYLVDPQWVATLGKQYHHIRYLPHAGSPDAFYPIQNTTKKYDVVFVGDSFKGNTEGMKRAEALTALVQCGIRVGLYGDLYWKNDPVLTSAYQGLVRSTNALNEVYNQAYIALNIHHGQLRDGTNQRTFEAALSGTFQMSDYKKCIPDLFEDTIGVYSNTEELVQKVQWFLEHKDAAKEKAREARAIALRGHLYAHRIATLLQSE